MNFSSALFFPVLSISALHAFPRDPFSYGGTYHFLTCVGIGRINSYYSCARIYDDGVLTMLKLHDTYKGGHVVSITSERVSLKERTGLEHHIMVETQKKTK